MPRVSMYHDQDQIAMKLMGFEQGVTLHGSRRSASPLRLCRIVSRRRRIEQIRQAVILRPTTSGGLNMTGSFRFRALAVLGCCALTGTALAQNIKPPKAQLWMDLSTGTMAGMPEMDLPAGGGAAAMMGGLMGGRGGAGGGNTAYGAARGMNFMPPRVLDIALYNRLKPGIEASQTIPPGMQMGDSLPLVPPKAEVREHEPGEMPRDMPRETPKGRILIYWGCAEAVRTGQPRVIDLARGNAADFGAAFAGRYTPDRGARVGPAYALYPNEKNRVNLSRDSSLVGQHQVLGDGVPASMKFTLGAAQDLMPPIDLQTSGAVKDSMKATWRQVANARAYYLHAMGQVGDDMVMWSSSETGDTGSGLFDYLPNATIDRWLKERVLLQPETTQCAIPAGIFAGAGAGGRNAQGAMLRMMAYGSESNFAYPPRPTDPRATWEPDWAVRVRVKSSTMAMLGDEQGAARRSAAGTRRERQREQMPSGSAGQQPPETAGQEAQENQEKSGAGSLIPLPGNLLKGLFGR